MLEALGYPLDLTPEQTATLIEETGFGFMFAPNHHPSMRHAVPVRRELGIPTDQFTSIFAIARTAGWLAHWREQVSENRIFRPTQIYNGHDTRHYMSISQR